MSDPTFFAKPKPASLAEIASWTGARLAEGNAAYVRIEGVGRSISPAPAT